MAFADHIARVDAAARKHLGGVPVTYAPTVGDPVEVEGMFDEPYVLVEENVEMITPMVCLTLADLPSDALDDRAQITVAGSTYKVREAKPDAGKIQARFLLHEVG